MLNISQRIIFSSDCTATVQPQDITDHLLNCIRYLLLSNGKTTFFFFLAHLHKITVNGVHSNDYWQGCFHLYLWRKISSLSPHIFLPLPPCNSSGCSCVNRADKIQYGLLRIWHCAFPKTFKRALATTLFIIFTYCVSKQEKANSTSRMNSIK